MSAIPEQLDALARALCELDGGTWATAESVLRMAYNREAQGHALALAILRPLPAPECGNRCHTFADDMTCRLPPGHEGDHEGGDRTYDHDATRAEIERLRREVERLTCAAERADDVALQSQESRLTSLDDARRLVAERDAARAELVAAQDVASRRYGDIQDLRYELKDARAELARLRAPVCCRALCKYAGREDEPCWGEVGVDEDVSKNGGEIPHLCSGHWYGMYTPEPPAALAQGARAEGER